MQISNIWPSLSLFFSISLASPVANSLVPINCATTIQRDQAPINAVKYGWKGSGVYRLHNLQTSLVVSLNQHHGSGSIVEFRHPIGGLSEYWVIADVGGKFVLANNGTGLLLSAVATNPHLLAYDLPITQPTGRWTIDFHHFGGIKGNPVIFHSWHVPGRALGHHEPKFVADTGTLGLGSSDDIIITDNEGWFLEYLD